MDISIIIAALSIIVAALSALYARQSAKSSEETLMSQTLIDLLNEYRSIDMYIAIKSLWQFYREHSNDLVAAYKEQYQKDDVMSQQLPKHNRVEFEKNTLHFQRRSVSQFYMLLAGLHERGLSKSGIYLLWTDVELQIIPKILIPLEKSLAQELTIGKQSPNIEKMQKLYDDYPTKNKYPG